MVFGVFFLWNGDITQTLAVEGIGIFTEFISALVFVFHYNTQKALATLNKQSLFYTNILILERWVKASDKKETIMQHLWIIINLPPKEQVQELIKLLDELKKTNNH